MRKAVKHYGHYEMLKIAHQAVSELERYMDFSKDERTLRDSVSNAILAYRPNFSTGKLQPVFEQAWARELKLFKVAFKFSSFKGVLKVFESYLNVF